MKALFALLIAGFFLSGCDQVVGDYVKGVTPAINVDDNLTISSPSGPMALKISPGHVESTASDMRLEATVTPSKRTMTASDMSAEISLNRTRLIQ